MFPGDKTPIQAYVDIAFISTNKLGASVYPRETSTTRRCLCDKQNQSSIGSCQAGHYSYYLSQAVDLYQQESSLNGFRIEMKSDINVFD